MKPHFLFPQSPIHTRTMIDEIFQDQALTLRAAGFTTGIIDESMEIRGMRPPIDSTIVYRGWMMNTDQYSQFLEKLRMQCLRPLTSLEQYLATHYLPNWYSQIEDEDLTPFTSVFPLDCQLLQRSLKEVGAVLEDHVKSMRGLHHLSGHGDGSEWKKFQIKDYVKSLKTDGGSVFTDTKDIIPILEKMEKYRGTIEGGVCVRAYEDLKPGTETRYFILNGKFHGPGWSFPTWAAIDPRVIEILQRLCNLNSPFFSVDIAQRMDGEYRVVEIGDGQVSDITGWTADRFAEIWRDA